MVFIISDDIPFILSSLQSSEKPDIKLFYLQQFSKEAIANAKLSSNGRKGEALNKHRIKSLLQETITPTSPIPSSSDAAREWSLTDPFSLGEEARLGNVHWTLDRLLSIGRLIRCDERFLWERLGPNFFQRFQLNVRTLLSYSQQEHLHEGPRMNLWIEQQAAKWVREFLCHRGACECSLHAKKCAPDPSVAEKEFTGKEMNSSRGEKLEVRHSTAEEDNLNDQADLSLWRELILYMTKVLKPTPLPIEVGSTDVPANKKEEEKKGMAKAMATSSTTIHTDRASGELVEKTVEVVPMKVFEEGCLRCSSSLPAFSELLRIPLHQLFCRETVKRYSPLGSIIDGSPGLRSSIGDHEETFLVICLVYERFVVGEESSHWKALLKSCPASYPLMPRFWDAWELGELEGVDMLEEVLKRKEEISRFHGRMQDVLPLLSQILSSVALSEKNSKKKTPPSYFSLPNLQAIFSLDALHWASATFDSRAFYLNLRGNTILALSPIADMINHQCRSDVLVRCMRPPLATTSIRTANTSLSRPAGGLMERKNAEQAKGKMTEKEEKDPEFVLEIGAPLTKGDKGRELWMSYGPLQNWELLQYYGFVLEDNLYDTLPFPLQDFSSFSTPGDHLESLAERTEEDDWQQQRAMLAKTYFLNTLQRFWIGVDGVPCPALLALLRLQLASAQELNEMVKHAVRVTKGTSGARSTSTFPMLLHSEAIPTLHKVDAIPQDIQRVDPFTPQQESTEIDVCKAIEETVQCILQLFSTTLEEDEESLKVLEQQLASSHRGNGEDERTGTDGEREGKGDRDAAEEEVYDTGEEGEHYLAYLRQKLALTLRIHLKRIAHRCLEWCERQHQELKSKGAQGLK